MKACGIVAEYNPFHKGHAYQIEQIKANSDADVIIAVMSGNFLQRGEPAIVDKWTRTAMALSEGIDLVIELPVIWSVQPADLFAKGAIELLNSLEINYLSFGTEAGTTQDFLEGARFLYEKNDEILDAIQKNKDMNMPYAKKLENTILKLNPKFPLDLNLPNVQLALSYQKELFKIGKEQKIKTLPIKRIGSAYSEEKLKKDSTIASATAIRKAIFSDQEVYQYLGNHSYSLIKKNADKKVSWESYFLLLKYQLILKSKAELREVYEMTEGLENRLKKHVEESDSFEELINKIKTKRYTRTRLQRLLSYVLLNIKKTDVEKFIHSQSPIRILGFNQSGRLYLNQIKDELSVPIIANVNQETKYLLANDIKTGKIYRLGNDLIDKQDFSRKPIIID